MGKLIKKRWLAASGSIAALTAIAFPFPAGAICPSQLPAVMEAIATRPELARARVGIQVETLTGEVIYSREGDRFFVPASTLKLLTTAAVLTELGPNYTIRTSVLGTANEDGSTSLKVLGRGDPSFDQADLEALATQLVQQGVSKVDELVADEQAIPGAAVNPNWEWEDVQAGYGAPVNALILNQNEIGLSLVPQAIDQPLQIVWDNPSQATGWTIENESLTVMPGEPEFVTVGRDLGEAVLRVGGQLVVGSAPETTSIAEPNPTQAFLDAFRITLIAQGIRIQPSPEGNPLPNMSWTELAFVESPTLRELLVPTNQDSNNLYAEALLKQLGRQDATATDATAAGIAIALRRLQDLGLDPQAVVMVDGSGLSRKNLITPEAMVDVLQGMARSPNASIYRDSLAVLGQSGTLRNRLPDTPITGQFYGKSGAISRNFALAGYLKRDDQPALALSIFLNNINERGSVARQIIDEILLQVAALEPCDET